MKHWEDRAGGGRISLGMTVLCNLAGWLTLALGIAAWAAAQMAGFDAHKLIAGFGTMAVLGVALELQPKPKFRPRYFWIVPAWLIGALGAGMALQDVNVQLGYATLGAAGLAVAAIVARDIARKPGGRWLTGLTVAAGIVAAFQIMGAVRPEWSHPALYVVNALAMAACVFYGWKLYRARTAGEIVAS